MKDIHNHALFGVDDGAKTIDDSIRIISELYDNGITDIILTPHFINESRYSYNNKEKKQRITEIKKILKEKSIKVNLYLGNEVLIDLNIEKNIKKGNISTINGSNYILIEFSMHNRSQMDKNILVELVNLGYTPILAHPERYPLYHGNYAFFEDLIKNGILLQGNLRSLVGLEGKKAKKMLEGLLKRNMIHFMGTDIHDESLKSFEKAKTALRDLTNDIIAIELLSKNVDKVIKNERITPYDIIKPRKRGFFGKFSLFI